MAQPPTDPTHVRAGPVERGDDRIRVQGAEDSAVGSLRWVRTQVVGTVVVLEVAGLLSDVVADLDLAIRLALADGPRGVVCDLTAILEDARRGQDARKGGQACARLARDPGGRGLPRPVGSRGAERASLGKEPDRDIVDALRGVRGAGHPTPSVAWLRLAAHPSAPRAARDFVTRTLLGWGLGSVIPCASLVVSELVTNSTMHAETDIKLSVAWHLGAVRLTVRDHSPDLPHHRPAAQELHGRGLTIVTGASRAFGVLPTTDDAKVVWAVLEAPGAQPSTSPNRADPATKESANSSIPAPRPLPPEPLEGHHALAQHGAPWQFSQEDLIRSARQPFWIPALATLSRTPS